MMPAKKEFTIRVARPEDADALARLCYLAGQGHSEISVYDLMIPGPAGPTTERLGFIARMMTAEAPSWLGYIHLINTTCFISCLQAPATGQVHTVGMCDDFRRAHAGVDGLLRLVVIRPVS